MKTLIRTVAASALVALMLAANAAAGGFATVQLSSTPTGTDAGTPWSVDLTVLQHGVTPLDGIEPLITISDGSSEQVVPCRADGRTRRVPRRRDLPGGGHVDVDDLGRVLADAHLQPGGDSARQRHRRHGHRRHRHLARRPRRRSSAGDRRCDGRHDREAPVAALAGVADLA